MSRARTLRVFSLILPLLAFSISTSEPAFGIGAPVLVKDINPGSAGSNPQSLLSVAGGLFFAAQNAANGVEPWASDATEPGTTLLADANPGASSGFGGNCLANEICEAVRIGSTVYFSAYTGIGGPRLWRTDGTSAGTSIVYSDAAMIDLENVAGTLYLAAVPTGFSTASLWTSDGTAGGTTQVTTNVFVAGNLTDVNGTLFFSGTNGFLGSEIWKKDGSPGGASMVKDLNPGSPDNGATFLTNVNGTLFFFGIDAAGGGLCKSDGTDAGTFRLKSLTMEANQFTSGQIVDANGTAFLIASDGASGMELWKSDGTVGGTVLVKDIYPGSPGGLSGSFLVAIGSTVYFAASDGAVGRELWKSDGTEAGTVLVKDIYPGFGEFGASTPAGLAGVNGKLFFRAESPSPSGHQLWMSDGTEAGTVRIAIMNPSGNCLAQSFTGVGSDVFFSGTNGTSGVELWVMSDEPVGVGPNEANASGSVALAQNQPNPVRATTQISYSIPVVQHVLLKLYDVSGRELHTLVNGQQPAGVHQVEVDVRGLLPSGVYFYRLETERGVLRKKMVLAR
ncbi:MAG: ELWxxDGT repeat protein [bacterium]